MKSILLVTSIGTADIGGKGPNVTNSNTRLEVTA